MKIFKEYIKNKYANDIGYKYLFWPKQKFNYKISLTSNYKSNKKVSMEQFKLLNLIEWVIGQRIYVDQKMINYRFKESIFITRYKINLCDNNKYNFLYYFAMVIIPAYRQTIFYKGQDILENGENKIYISGSNSEFIIYIPFKFWYYFLKLDWISNFPIFIKFSVNMGKFEISNSLVECNSFLSYKPQRDVIIFISKFLKFTDIDKQFLNFYSHKKIPNYLVKPIKKRNKKKKKVMYSKKKKINNKKRKK
jgi:hypothetical protein